MISGDIHLPELPAGLCWQHSGDTIEVIRVEDDVEVCRIKKLGAHWLAYPNWSGDRRIRRLMMAAYFTGSPEGCVSYVADSINEAAKEDGQNDIG